MKSSEVRSKFIEFFKSKEHAFVPGSSTIPLGDQTILFTIAGMAQFKSALTGEEKRPYKRATNSQKCIRIGDLDDVGKDGRHGTMFEMLGSWSFGDYFKKEAIAWAREFVQDQLRFDMSKIWVSVHEKDDEAAKLWENAGQPAERIVRLGDKDNFWAMGPTGPCGPCTELHLDQGPEVGKCEVKGFDCKAGPGCDCDRYLEFWNLVFMQYDRKEDGTLTPLEMQSIDTGSGLERVTALLQGKTSIFDIDSFESIKDAIRARASLPPEAGKEPGAPNTLSPAVARVKESLNVISDHIRLLTFTLADGCNFGSEGRGYVLRRVLRRAVRHAHRLNPAFPRGESFLASIVPAVVKELGDFYPEIKEQQARISELIRQEESRFVQTLDSGLTRFNEFVVAARAAGRKELSGDQVFQLHDTFGFPWDLTKVLGEEIGFGVDMKGFQEHMLAQKEKSRAEAKFYKFDQDDSPWIQIAMGTQDEEKAFEGYGITNSTATKDGAEVHEVALQTGRVTRVRQLKNGFLELVLSRTPFYPEGGGQVADTGWIVCRGEKDVQEFEVLDVRKTPAAVVHLLRHAEWSEADAPRKEEQALKALFSPGAQANVGTQVTALVNVGNRVATARNHTATHLLHKALQLVLGDSVRQAGSMVSPQGLRFDFSHHRALTADEIARVETIVNREILRNADVHTHQDVLIDDAKRMGAMAIFDEKYEDRVRVLQVGDFSMELCGGTHVPRTGHIGLLRVTGESSVTAGVRRIEAVTGWKTVELMADQKNVLSHVAGELKSSEHDVVSRIAALKESQKELERSVGALQSRLVGALVDGVLGGARDVNGVKVVSTLHEASDLKELEMLADRLKEKSTGVTVVASSIGGKAVVLAAVAPALSKQHKNLSAGTLVKQLCEVVDGKGGGRPDFARGGGNAPEKLPQALAKVDDIVRALMS